MKERWLRIGVLAGALFAINAVGRLVVRFGSIDDVDSQQQATLLTYGVIALGLAIVAGLWGRRRPLGPVAADLTAGVTIAGVLILTLGPLLSGTTPAAVGAGDSFTVAWQYAGFAAGGALVGSLLLTMTGRDYHSQSLKRFAETRSSKPPRTVRR